MRTFALALLTTFVSSCAAAGDSQVVPPSVSPFAAAPLASAPASSAPIASVAPSASSSAPTRPPPVFPPDMKQVVQRWLDAFNTHDTDKLAATYDKSAPIVVPTESGFLEGKSGNVKTLMAERQKLFAMLPDVRMDLVRQMISPGSVTTVEWVLSATDTSRVPGAAKTHAPIGVRGVSTIWCPRDYGALVGSETDYYDVATLYDQAAGKKTRPVAKAPDHATYDWADALPETGDDGTNPIELFYAAFGKNDVNALTTMVTEDVVFGDQTKPADVVGKKAFLAEVAARAKSGLLPGNPFIGNGLVIQTSWTRGSRTMRSADVVVTEGGKVVSMTVFANAREAASK